MTSPESNSLDQAPVDVPAEPGAAPAIAPFRFPQAADFAPVKQTTDRWYQKSGKPGAKQTPGPAPSGTRRSMGKR